MALESLMKDTFRRGCGISRRYALRSERYRELRDSFPHVPYTQPNERAEMVLLGEMLADRAFKNLPKHLRESAHLWDVMSPEEHRAVINEMMHELTAKQWKRLSFFSREVGKNDVESLPASTGSWRRGKHQPNCQGMAQMLVGFARAAGIPHLLVDVHDEKNLSALRTAYLATRRLENLLAPYANHRRIRKIWRLTQEQQLVQLSDLSKAAENYQSHGCIVARIDGTWMLIDPYLSTLHDMGRNSKEIDKFYDMVARYPIRRVIIASSSTRTGFNGPMRAVEHAVKALESTEHDNHLEDLIEIAGRYFAGSMLDYEAYRKATYRLIADFSVQAAYIARLSQKKLTSDPDDYGRVLGERPNRSLVLRKRFFVRVLREVSLLTLKRIAKLQLSSPGEHALIELGHPALNLATSTINHQALLTGQTAAELVRFDRGMSILHDTFAEIAEGKSRRLQQVQTHQLRKLERLHPHLVLIGLREHLNPEGDTR